MNPENQRNSNIKNQWKLAIIQSMHRMVLNYNEPPMRIQDLILLLNKKYPLIHGKGRVAKITNNMF